MNRQRLFVDCVLFIHHGPDWFIAVAVGDPPSHLSPHKLLWGLFVWGSWRMTLWSGTCQVVPSLKTLCLLPVLGSNPPLRLLSVSLEQIKHWSDRDQWTGGPPSAEDDLITTVCRNYIQLNENLYFDALLIPKGTDQHRIWSESYCT